MDLASAYLIRIQTSHAYGSEYVGEDWLMGAIKESPTTVAGQLESHDRIGVLANTDGWVVSVIQHFAVVLPCMQ